LVEPESEPYQDTALNPILISNVKRLQELTHTLNVLIFLSTIKLFYSLKKRKKTFTLLLTLALSTKFWMLLTCYL
jgi:hypothetical protein